MEKSKHTPGPWAVGEGGMHVYYLNPLIEAGDESIDDPRHDSIIAKCDDFGPFSGIDDEECAANTRLIAAAPDHHQNAIWADNIFSNFANNPAFREVLDAFGYCQSFDEWMTANRAAIAKAKGE